MKGLCFVLCFCVLVPMARAQTGEKSESGKQRHARMIASGDSLPLYQAVEGFFSHCFNAYRSGEDVFAFNILRPLGIKANTEASHAIVQSTLLAKALMEEPPSTRSQGLDFRQSQILSQRKRAGRLGDLYRALLAELERSGVSRDSLETFIYEAVAPGIYVHSTGTDEEIAQGIERRQMAFGKGWEEER